MARKMRLKKPAAKDGATSYGRRGKNMLSLLFGLVSIYVLAGMEYGELSSYIGGMTFASSGQDTTSEIRRRRDFYSVQEAERISGEEPHSHTYIKRTVPGSRHRPLTKAETTITDASEAPALAPTSDAPNLSLPPLPESKSAAEESELFGLLNATLCERPRCIDQRGISPAEIAGEDDNSAKQIAAVKAGKEYTVSKCKPCDRMRRFQKSITKGRAVFVHIPKTAGSTIEYIFGIGGSCHATAAVLEACEPEMYRDALTFTIIRNPVDRVISMYDYAKAGGNVAKYAWVTNSSTFEEFANGLDPFDYSHAPMVHYLYDGMSNASSIGVKEVLCFDDLAAGWDRLAAIESRLKRGSDGQLVNLTTTHRRVGRHNVTDLAGATMDRIQKYYGEDFKLWEEYCGGRGSQILPDMNITTIL